MKTKFIYGAIAALFALNVSLCAFAQDDPTWIEDDEDVINGISPCISGGPGAKSCNNQAHIDFVGELGGGASCEVTCGPGYYACCGLKCTCERMDVTY